MKGWVLNKTGVENLVLTQNVPIPELDDEFSIRIRVKAVGLNPVDAKRCEWESEAFPLGRVVGIDGAGIVDKIGSSVDKNKFKEGETIVFFHGNVFNKSGAYAEYYVHDSRFLTVVPKEVTDSYPEKEDLFRKLASIPCVALTSYQILFSKLKLSFGSMKEETLNRKLVRSFFVGAGAGGVGGYCLQLIRMWILSLQEEERNGIKVITTCSDNNVEYVKSLGATHTINYRMEDIVERVKDITDGLGVDAWIDGLGVGGVETGLQALAFGGELVSITGSPQYDMNELFIKAQTIHHVYMGYAYFLGVFKYTKEIGEMGDRIIRWIQEGHLGFLPLEVYPFEDLINALIKVSTGHVRGKVVVDID
mmetsp:Transcript_60078/g.68359  ORF Transcript_60078/g.68359 Transcript_60078/m.68359 type:complete len:363 (+) Transcript_60078:58-1146(+)|eukprot:CAMPEP_0115036974 /NCGR_PEP_ID=MMETSP0216-20121206/42484_1 /TAXON_ID=223996 /ORGANISM="Protocruzia adherens, Strain Boccale" /LENGTH=362 /DNA_ID=CAMNT_0002416989 /DNA_START=18 /DNA_END=1106 /DNA_ORIENTATION=+